jgi:hypothetical protein
MSKDLVDRLASLLEDLRISNELLNKFPLNEEYKKVVVISYEKLGNYFKNQLNEDEIAKSYFEKAKKLKGS